MFPALFSSYDVHVHGETKRFLLTEKLSESIKKKKSLDASNAVVKKVVDSWASYSGSSKANYIITSAEVASALDDLKNDEIIFDVSVTVQPRRALEHINIGFEVLPTTGVTIDNNNI